jgi:hypothetical protein
MSGNNLVKIIDGNKQKQFETKVPVFKDDLVRTIKEKLFYHSYYLYPEFLVLKIENEKGSVILDDEKYLYEYLGEKENTVWFYNVLSLKKTPLSVQRSSWDKLNEEESSIIYNHREYDENVEYKKFIEFVKFKHIDVGKFENDKLVANVPLNLDLLYKEPSGDIYKKIKNSVVILNINKSLDLSIVFKHLELDENIPFITYKENIKKNASVKVLQSISKDLLKEWSLQEVKGVKSIKGGKGLTFRIKFGTGYSRVNISNKIITIKCDFSNNKQNTKTCIAGIGEGLDKINKIQGFEIISQSTKSYSAELIVNTTFRDMDFGLKYFDIFFEYAPVPEKEKVSDIMHIKYHRTSKPVDIFIRTFQDRKSITIQTESDIQLDLILSRLLQLFSLFDNHIVLDNIIRDISNVKKLKKYGAIIDTISCQKGRQPTIDNDLQPLTDKNGKSSYAMNYNGLRYICNNPLDVFPGFTTKGTPCCFKTNQTTKSKYQEMMNPSEIKLFPSNLPIKIFNETFLVLKDESGTYVYINNTGDIVEIDDIQLIKKIDFQQTLGNIWINLSPLNKLINNTISSKCLNQPENVLKRTCKNAGIFGYQSSGEPCCFKNKRDIRTDIKRETGHIITTDKILGHQRTGELYDIFKNLFTPKHFRIGILQSDISFINATISSLGIESPTEKIKSFILKSLDENMYDSLFGISEIFSYEKYKNYLTTQWVDHKFAIEIISKIFKINIIVLNYKEENSSISCTMNLIDTPFVDGDKYIVLIKNNKTYEPIKLVENEKKRGVFKRSEIQNLIDLYTFSCKAIKPENYPLNLNELLQVIKEPTKVTQIVNNARLVNFVNYNDFIIPVKVSKPILKLGEGKMKVYDAEYQIEKLNGLNIPELKVVGQLVGNQGKVIALITVSDLVIPVNIGNMIENLTVLNLNYYENINEIFQLNKTLDDKRILHVLERIINEEYTNRIFFTISEYLKDNDEIKQKLIDIVKNSAAKLTIVTTSEKNKRKYKVEKIQKIITPIVDKLFSSERFDVNPVKITDSFRINCPSIKDKNSCNIKDYCIWESSCSLKSMLDKENISLTITQSILKSNDIIDGISNEMISSDNFIKRKSEITFINTEQIDRWLEPTTTVTI